MGKQLSMAASILCMAIVALAVVGDGEAAVVEHTFVVSSISMLPRDVDPADRLISCHLPEFVILLAISPNGQTNCRSMR